MPPVMMLPLNVGTVPEVYTMPFDVHAPLDRMGPWVPRYVTTGCSALFATGFALAMPATTRTVVRRDVMETIVNSGDVEMEKMLCLYVSSGARHLSLL